MIQLISDIINNKYGKIIVSSLLVSSVIWFLTQGIYFIGKLWIFFGGESCGCGGHSSITEAYLTGLTVIFVGSLVLFFLGGFLLLSYNFFNNMVENYSKRLKKKVEYIKYKEQQIKDKSGMLSKEDEK